MNIMCSHCGGKCCMEMNSPPFVGNDDPALLSLPQPVLEDYELGMEGRESSGWPDGVPCFWLVDGKCKYYEYRPAVCRELAVGSEGCLRWIEAAKIDKEASQ